MLFPSQAGLNPLRGSGPLQGPGQTMAMRGTSGELIMTSPTGPRLSTEGPMRTSAEAYLRGSTEVGLERIDCRKVRSF